MNLRHKHITQFGYTSPYMVITEQEYTKHYYAGSQRIASKLGAGFGGALVDMDVNVETINADVETIASDLVDLLERTNTCAQIESGNVTMPELNLPAIEELRNTSIDNLESDMYFYHSDHLGSSSWITDASGAVNQHLQYLPLRQAHFDKLNAPQGGAFGESFVFQNSSSWQSPYTFSGKEKDSEIERSGDSRTPLKNKQESEQTGYSYFGARYGAWPDRGGNADLSIWLSVDPLADKYPNTSPFMYLAGNPEML